MRYPFLTACNPPVPSAVRLLVFVAASALSGVFGAAVVAAPVAEPMVIDAGGPGGNGVAGMTSNLPPEGLQSLRWLEPPTDDFELRSDWGRVRTASLLRGVSGQHFSLEADLAPGRWTVIAFLDDGFEDSHLVEISIDGRRMAHGLREFGRASEPVSPPICRYRVVQFEFDATGATRVGFGHPSGEARLLALKFLPMDWQDTERIRWYRDRVQAIGSIDSIENPEAIQVELKVEASSPDMRNFAAYWLAQLELLAEAEKWHDARGWDWVSVKTASKQTTRYKIAVGLLDGLAEHPAGSAFALRDRAQWRRARILHHLWLEMHNESDRSAAASDLAALRSRFPSHRLVAMYSGERFTDDRAVQPGEPGAPAWARAQFEVLQRLRRVAHYWVDERQASNGEMGGMPDDDVEMFRWWPALWFTGDAKALAGFARMAEGIWFNRGMHLGYSRAPRDVEHSAEFVADTVPMMAFLTASELWIDRLAWSHRHMRDLWTGVNSEGQLQFKSAWIGATTIQSDPPKNRDLAMNARAAKAVRFLAWLRGDEGADELLHRWSRTWVAAAGRTDKGKPPGLFPASLRWPDAAFNGDEPSWHAANMYWRYFDWDGGGQLYDQLLFSWVRTADDSLHEPMLATLAFLAEWSARGTRTGLPAGSAEWAARELLESSGFWGVVTQWRLETGNSRFDDLLLKHGPPFLRYKLTGDAELLAEGIERSLLDELRHNTEMRTTEVLFTDRVYVSRPVGNWEGRDLLAGMITGNHSPGALSPYFQVSWDDAPEGFTALVTDAGSDRFHAELFLHGNAAVINPRLFRLSPGNYAVSLSADGVPIGGQMETIANRGQRVRLDVPRGTLVKVAITRENGR